MCHFHGWWFLGITPNLLMCAWGQDVTGYDPLKLRWRVRAVNTHLLPLGGSKHSNNETPVDR